MLTLGPVSGTPYIATVKPGHVHITSGGLQQIIKSNYSALLAPTATDDSDSGYTVGSPWVNTVTGIAYTCVDATPGAAQWKDVSSSTNPAGVGTELQYRSSSTSFGAVTGSSFAGSLVTLPTLAVTDLTSGRIPYVGTAGRLQDSTDLQWNNAATTLTLGNATIASAVDGTITLTASGANKKFIFSALNPVCIGSAPVGTEIFHVGGESYFHALANSDVVLQLVGANGQTVDVFQTLPYGSSTPYVSIGPSTLPTDASKNFFKVAGTMPALNASHSTTGVLFDITGAGTASYHSTAMRVNYNAGYTGGYSTWGLYVSNANAGSADNPGGNLYQCGILGQVTAGSGSNVGVDGRVSAGNKAYGGSFWVNGGGTGIGCTGAAYAYLNNAVGGIFALDPGASGPFQAISGRSALIARKGASQAYDIFRADDINSGGSAFETVFLIADAGATTISPNDDVVALKLAGPSGLTADLFQANPYGVTAGTRARVTSAGEFSHCPITTSYTELFGAGATAGGGYYSTVIGNSANALGSNGTAIGYGAVSRAQAVAVGTNAVASYPYCILLGNGATDSNSSGYVFVAGSPSVPMNDVYFGSGRLHTAPTNYTIHGTGGSGTNVVGGNLYIAPGQSTGSGTPASVVIQGTTAGASGSTAQTLVDVVKVDSKMTVTTASGTVCRLANNSGGGSTILEYGDSLSVWIMGQERVVYDGLGGWGGYYSLWLNAGSNSQDIREVTRVTSSGEFGVGTTAPDKQVEINSATGDCLRLTYNDSNGSATNYADFAISSGGNLTITPSGGTTSFSGKVVTPNSGALTIATGVITVTGAQHTVDTEAAAAADDLDTINGGKAGEKLILRLVNAARIVTIKHATGNIRRKGGTDYVFTGTDEYVELFCTDGSNWLIN